MSWWHRLFWDAQDDISKWPKGQHGAVGCTSDSLCGGRGFEPHQRGAYKSTQFGRVSCSSFVHEAKKLNRKHTVALNCYLTEYKADITNQSERDSSVVSIYTKVLSLEQGNQLDFIFFTFFILFSFRLLSVLIGHSVFSSIFSFITSLVWRGPWLGIEPGTSRTRSQHYTTRLSRRRWSKGINLMTLPENYQRIYRNNYSTSRSPERASNARKKDTNEAKTGEWCNKIKSSSE